MTSRPSRIALGIADGVLLLSAAFGLAVPLAHFTGWLEHAPWLNERVSILTLLMVGLVLLDVVLERRLRLDRLADSVLALRRAHQSGIRYLPDAESAETATTDIAQRATQSILALGAKSKRSKYLNALTEAAKTRKIPYHRLIDGLYITHELHQHLASVIDQSNVKISWTPDEKYADLLVTEGETLLAFPSPWPDRFSALELPGLHFARQYTEYFFAAFTAASPVAKKEALNALCGKCGPNTERTPHGLAAVLVAEQK